MEILNPCCCCLLRSADKDLNTPYIFLGATDTFSDMLEECFRIHFNLTCDYECGICDTCATRLRDARDFKLQVQRCQEELQVRLERARDVKEEDLFKFETSQYAYVKVEGFEEKISGEKKPIKLETPHEVSDDMPAEVGNVAMVIIKSERVVKAETSGYIVRDEEPPSFESGVGVGKGDMEARASLDPGLVTAHAGGLHSHTTPTISTQQSQHETDTDTALLTECTRTNINDKSFGVFQEKLPQKSNILPTDDKPYICDICKKQFTRKLHLIRHIRTHTGDTGDKLFACDLCNKNFTRKYALNEHIRIHTLQKPYSCEFCFKKFSQIGTLTRHLRIHTGEKPYTCEICNKRFTRKAHLTRHIRTHTGEKRHTCDLCNKKFTEKYALDQHIKTHTGQKPYSCELCFKMFSQNALLTRHKRTHTGEKPYTCDICNTKFTQRTALNSHIRTHSGLKPYSCQICFKKFSQVGTLSRHKRSHTGDKPYACDICNKRFTQKPALINHIGLHSEQKPYSCELCLKKFSLIRALTRHKRIHTGEKHVTGNLGKNSV